jgi:hypothetical protein
MTRPVSDAASNSHPVAAVFGCTNIPLASGEGSGGHRTGRFPASGLYGAFFVKGITPFLSCFVISILLFKKNIMFGMAIYFRAPAKSSIPTFRLLIGFRAKALS